MSNSDPNTPPERAWRLVASLAASGFACALVVVFLAPTVASLWELATFTPKGPIRPMGLTAYMVVGMFVGWVIGFPLSHLASKLSQRPAAEAAAAAAMLVAASPVFCFLIFFVIVFARGIQLGD